MKKLAWILAISDPLLRRTALRGVRLRSVIDRKHGPAYRDRPAIKIDAPERWEPQGGVGGHFEGIEGATQQRADLHRESEKGTSDVRIRKKKAAVKARRNRKRFRLKKRLPVPSLKRRSLMAAVRRSEHTDVGNAERFITLHGQDFKYCAEWEKWLAWDGRKWVLCANDAEAIASGISTVRAMLREANVISSRSPESAWATKCHDIGRIKSMIHLASRDPRLAVSHNELDGNNSIINVENGIVNLHTGELMVHDRSYLCTKMANVSYDPAAICPRWIQFLETSMQDPDMINMLQRIAGYSMTGSVSEQCLFFFYGGGSNGKTTFLSTLQKILGDYAHPAPRGLLESDRNNDHDTRLAYLYRARLVVCSEVESGKHIAEALVKDLTGGERISARRMREDPWSFDPTAKIIVAGNHKPVVAGQDHGFWRRMKLIPWTITIEESQKDPDLLQKLEAEYTGIFNWAVMGCVAWKTDGSGLRTNLVDHHVQEYKSEQLNDQKVSGLHFFEVSSDFEKFCEEKLDFDVMFKVAKRDLSDEYLKWCKDEEKEKHPPQRLYGYLRRFKKILEKDTMGAPIKVKDSKGDWDRGIAGIKIKLKSV